VAVGAGRNNKVAAQKEESTRKNEQGGNESSGSSFNATFDLTVINCLPVSFFVFTGRRHHAPNSE
jgi:hypothetical protein